MSWGTDAGATGVGGLGTGPTNHRVRSWALDLLRQDPPRTLCSAQRTAAVPSRLHDRAALVTVSSGGSVWISWPFAGSGVRFLPGPRDTPESISEKESNSLIQRVWSCSRNLPHIILKSGLARNFTRHSYPPGISVGLFDRLGHGAEVSRRFAPTAWICCWDLSVSWIPLGHESLSGPLINQSE